MKASDNQLFIDLTLEFQNKLISQIDEELAALCSCAAAGVPVNDMCVVKVDTSTPREPMQYSLGLLMINAKDLVKSGELNGFKSVVYTMK